MYPKDIKELKDENNEVTLLECMWNKYKNWWWKIRLNIWINPDIFCIQELHQKPMNKKETINNEKVVVEFINTL